MAATHSQGRGLFSVLLKNLPDIDSRIVREGEMVCTQRHEYRIVVYR